MEVIEIGEGAYILTSPEMNYVFFRSNIAVRLDSDNLVYMVKLEAEKDGYLVPVQAQVSLKEIIQAKTKGQSPLAAMIAALRPLVEQKWDAEKAKVLDAIPV